MMNKPIETGCYSAPDPRTRFQKLRDKLFPSKHCFAPEAPGEFKDCICGRAITKLSFVDRLRVLFTGVVVTQWRTSTENKVGRTINAATCHIGTAKDLTVVLIVLLLSSTCFAQDGVAYFQNSDSFSHDRKWIVPEKQNEASFLGTDGKWHPKPGACWQGVGLNGKWVMQTNSPKVYSGDGTFLGELSSNRYAPRSISNPYGVYGSRYSPQSIRNPHGPYGIYSAQPVYVFPRNR